MPTVYPFSPGVLWKSETGSFSCFYMSTGWQSGRDLTPQLPPPSNFSQLVPLVEWLSGTNTNRTKINAYCDYDYQPKQVRYMVSRLEAHKPTLHVEFATGCGLPGTCG